MLRRKLFLLLLVSISTMVKAQVPPTKAEIINAYIETYRELAIAEMQRTGVPASIKLAQGILETEAGRSDLVRRSNNHFGIKCKSTWSGAKVYHDDDARGECFRAYPSSIDSWRDHSDFLKNNARYAPLFKLDPDDYKGWANGLKAAGYATNPRYPQILIKYIEEYNLNDYTLIALGKKRAPDWRPSTNVMASPSPIAMATPAVQPEVIQAEITAAKSEYPVGIFMINETRVVFATAGTSIAKLADIHHVTAASIYEFNDLRDDEDILKYDQLIYLQRKRPVGDKEFYVVETEEDMYEISQRVGIRLENLLQYNQMTMNMKPALGEKIYLQKNRVGKAKLINSK